MSSDFGHLFGMTTQPKGLAEVRVSPAMPWVPASGGETGVARARGGGVLASRPVQRVEQWHPVAAAASVIVFGYAVIAIVLSGVGLAVTHYSPLTRWDESVNRSLAEHRTTFLNSWTAWATRIADTLGIVVVFVAVVIVLLLWRRRWDVLLLTVSIGLELAAFITVNTVVGRPRPDVIRLGSLPSTSSFPSGHTAAMVALYGGVVVIAAARLRLVVVLSWLAVALATAAIGFGRVYRGMHHPTDVVAGALLGSAALLTAVIVVRVGRVAVDARHQQRTDDPSSRDREVVA
jgi:undecaprenyl-diphosphatase